MALGAVGLITSPQDEQKIHYLIGLIRPFFKELEKTPLQASHYIRTWVLKSSLEKGQSKPFRLPLKAQTRATYRGYWRQFLTFVLRLYCMGPTLRNRYISCWLSPKATAFIDQVWNSNQWQYVGLNSKLYSFYCIFFILFFISFYVYYFYLSFIYYFYLSLI